MSDLVTLVSDVHCDIRHKVYRLRNPKRSETLIIAGDVASASDESYRDHLVALTGEFRQTAYVPGNHEFYGCYAPMAETLDFMDRVCMSLPGNVRLMRRGADPLDIPGTDTSVVGATLWTDANAAALDGEGLMNDFKMIRSACPEKRCALTVDDMREMHRLDSEHIDRSLAAVGSRGRRAIVATHHSPDIRLSLLNASRSTYGLGPFYYCSDMDDVFSNGRGVIKAWCYGHTHESHLMFLPDHPFPFVTNALGYPNESTGFGLNAGISI
jgi:predicted phosphodiesterase